MQKSCVSMIFVFCKEILISEYKDIFGGSINNKWP